MTTENEELLEAALEEACRFIKEELCDQCPAAAEGWECPDSCHNPDKVEGRNADDEVLKCWTEFFKAKAEGEA